MTLATIEAPDAFDIAPPENKKKLKYPKSVFFIVSNEFCERFCFYGMRTILALYLHQKLNYSEDTATTVYHAFVSFAYFTPIIGAMIADSWLGKFKTIFFLSIVYAIGSVVLSFAAMPNALPMEAFTIVGLFLIGFGTGGIKPCVSSFGGDQFVVPEQERQLQQFFSVFYFAVNGGSLLSTFITPILREEVNCFGEDQCYSLAFGVPAILMVVSIVIFVAGRPLYKVKKPEGNVVLKVSQCIIHALKQKSKSKGSKKREHWLDYAEEEYGAKMVADIKSALNVLLIFVPLPIFWALFDQQGSRWLFQGTRMNGDFGNGSFSLYPDQIQVFNPALVMILIPLFQGAIYPLFAKLNILQKPLDRMTVGGMLAAIAFVVSALIELSIKPTLAVLPTAGEAQLSIVNSINCNMTLTLNGGPFTEQRVVTVGPLEVAYQRHLAAQGMGAKFSMTAVPAAGCYVTGQAFRDDLPIYEEKALTFVLHQNDGNLMVSTPFEEDLEKSNKGNAKVRMVFNTRDGSQNRSVTFRKTNAKDFSHTFEVHGNAFQMWTEVADLEYGPYEVTMDGNIFKDDIYLHGGGVYNYVLHETTGGELSGSLGEMTQPNSVNILWQIPQYVIITSGEVMFSITGLEFAFTQAPLTMKSVMTSGWLVTVAFGNIIVIIIAEAKIFADPMLELFLFAALMAAFMLIFFLMSLRYKYVTVATEDSLAVAAAAADKKEKAAHHNEAFDSSHAD